MKKLLTILFILIAVGVWAQPNPNSIAYSYRSVAQAIKGPKGAGMKIDVIENGVISHFIIMRRSDGYLKPDSIMVIAMADSLSVLVRQAQEIQLEWFKKSNEKDWYNALQRLAKYASARPGTVVSLNPVVYNIDTMKTGTPIPLVNTTTKDSLITDSLGNVIDSIIIKTTDTILHITNSYTPNSITDVIWLDPQNLTIKGNGAIFSVKGNFDRKWTHSNTAGNVHFSAYNTVCPFSIAWGKNVTIENLTIDGNDDEMTESGGVNEGQDYGIWFRGTNGITVKDVDLLNLATDGLYFEGSGNGADGPNGGKHYHACRNAIVDHVRSLFCGRQGVTIGGLYTAHFKNCDFSNTGDTTGMGNYKGHAPGKGLDIEPVYEYAGSLIRTDRMTTNITFENCRFADNAGGSIALSHPLTVKGITFKKCILDNTKFNHFYFVINNVNDVMFDECDMSTGTGGFYLTRDNGANQKMTVKNGYITSGSGVFLTGSAAQYGVIVDNNIIRGKHDTTYKGYFPYFGSFGNYTRNTIIIDSALYLGANQKRLGFYQYANIVDNNTYLSEMDTTGGRKYNITYNFFQTITNEIFNPKHAVRPIGADTMHFENNAKFNFGEVSLGTQQSVYTNNGTTLHIYYKTSVPTTGLYNTGDIIVMTNPILAGWDHYRCTVGGNAALGTALFAPVGAISGSGAPVYHNAQVVIGSDYYIARYNDFGGTSKVVTAALPPGGIYITKAANDTGIVAFKAPLTFGTMTADMILKGMIDIRGKGNANFTVRMRLQGNNTFANTAATIIGDSSLISTKVRLLKDGGNNYYVAFCDTTTVLTDKTLISLESITLTSATNASLDNATATWTPSVLKSLVGYTATVIPNTAGGDYNLLINRPAAISLTTTGTSGAATYNLTTGVLNVPQYTGTGRTLTVSSTATLSLSYSIDYVYTGSTDANWTLPTINSNTGSAFTIRIFNKTTFNLYIHSNAGGNDIYTSGGSGGTPTYILGSNVSTTLVPDGTAFDDFR